MHLKQQWLWVVAAVCLATCLTRAGEAVEPAVSVDADFALYSAYVWRGQVFNDDPVFQPALNMSKGGFGFNAWGNCNLTDTDTIEPGLSEIDLTLSYGGMAGKVKYGFGLIEYCFIRQASAGDRSPEESPGSREVYASLSLPGLAVAPTINVYRDIAETGGTYASAGLVVSRELTKKLTLELATLLGVADQNYNDYYFGVAESAVNDLNVGATLSLQLRDSVSVALGLAYTWLPDAGIRDGAEALYGDGKFLAGGVTLNKGF